MACDRVKVILVRDGSAILFSEFGQQSAEPDDVIRIEAEARVDQGKRAVRWFKLRTLQMYDGVWFDADVLEQGARRAARGAGQEQHSSR